ncbi:hypothetical protein EYF80_003339 [Liparis tanakae]|uniref:Uncharacterized protein n=1 Tax=Liparis tanakae TaxID=230148 RepID=A0A4Z2J8R6_9TELE|nr:hypothetical protein EYF80_003339 [Liparis tanakae]
MLGLCNCRMQTMCTHSHLDTLELRTDDVMRTAVGTSCRRMMRTCRGVGGQCDESRHHSLSYQRLIHPLHQQLIRLDRTSRDVTERRDEGSLQGAQLCGPGSKGRNKDLVDCTDHPL